MTSKQTYSFCSCSRRRFRLAASEAPAEIKTLFELYSENGYMGANNLHRFLVEIQRERNATLADAESILKNFANYFFHLKDFNLEGFFKYLFGDINPPLNPNVGVHHDMTAPLSHYFIYTGHNSYLTGNQLSGACSDVPIINALRRGVRVIELDIWPNLSNNDVDVVHGRALTSPVSLIKCLRSIKDHAFSASEFPLVITLEDHLNAQLQAKVAEMISQTFGDLLFVPGQEGLKDFPSPEALKRKIIISTKPPKEYLVAYVPKKEKNELKQEKASNEKVVRDKKLHIILKLGFKDEESTEELEDDEADPKSQRIEAPEYRRLIAFHAGKGKGGLDDWLKTDPNKVRCVSLSELGLEKASETHARDIARFTQQNFLRVYPKGIRVDSSNYNPLIGWMHGTQMIALNMQDYGRSLWLMHGMFRANGGCGYVKKPDILLNRREAFDPKGKLRVVSVLKVTIYMGEGWYFDFRHAHFAKSSPPDFYARVGIAGVPNDTIMKRTRTLEDNWIPNWNEEFEFPLTVPELALLRVEVLQYDMSKEDDFGGQTCLPVSELREGIRAIPLHDHSGKKYKSAKLLVRFQFVH